MKIKNIIPSFVVAGAIAISLTACETENEHEEGHKETEAKLKMQAKVSEADARQMAMAKVPNGTIKEAELEKEHGKLIWSFDMSTPDSANTTEVNVDAITGKIVSIEHETPAQQAKEKAEDEKKEGKEKDDDDKK
jgi:uncharacterized membrane protein YkoI